MDSVEVSSADIARLAGVRPTAVSNWRRRHSDFPAPVGGTEKSPRFSLDEVQTWLKEQGRAVNVDPQRAFEQAASTAAMFTPVAETLRNALFALLGHAGEERATEEGWRRRLQADAAELAEGHSGLAGETRIANLDAAHVTMLNAALDAAAEHPVRELAESLYDETLSRRLLKGDTATPRQLAELMVALADPGDGPLVDIACGAGSILMAAARHGCRDVAGVETSLARAQLAALRLRAEGFDPPVRLRLHVVNALVADPFGPGTAAAVATNPPFNDRNWAQDVDEAEPWWNYGVPTGRDSELAWVQRALYQLRPGGNAVLVMPPSAASSSSGRRIRRQMLGDGHLRAVVALPRGSFHGTALAPHLWLLSRNDGPSGNQPVLTADFSDYLTDTQQPDWERISETVLATWTAFKSGRELAAESQATPVMALLGDGVDLTPGRHLPLKLPDLEPRRLERLKHETATAVDALTKSLKYTPEAAPEPTSEIRWETIGTLVQDAEISLHRGLPSESRRQHGTATIRTVRAESAEWAGEATIEPDQHVPRIREGDLLASVYGERIFVRQATDEDFDGAPALGTVIIRTDPRQIDPGFFAGFLASTLAQQQVIRGSTSLGVNTYRDLMPVRVPLPCIEDQQRYAALFTSLSGIAADAASLASQAHRLTSVWRDNAWAAMVGTDPVA